MLHDHDPDDYIELDPSNFEIGFTDAPPEGARSMRMPADSIDLQADARFRAASWPERVCGSTAEACAQVLDQHGQVRPGLTGDLRLVAVGLVARECAFGPDTGRQAVLARLRAVNETFATPLPESDLAAVLDAQRRLGDWLMARSGLFADPEQN